VYVAGGNGDELSLHASAPPSPSAVRALRLSELGPELAGGRRSPRIAVPLVANDELLGVLLAEGTSDVELGRAAANQAAVAIKKIDLIERLTEKNLIKDFFEELATGGNVAALLPRAERLACDLDEPHVVVVASPPHDDVERALAALAPRSLFDRRDNSLRGLLRVPAEGIAHLLDEVRKAHRELDLPVAAGISQVCQGIESFRPGFEEARQALLGTAVLRPHPAVLTYEELGPYKYLMRMSLEESARDSHRDAVARLAEYDRQRSTSLLATLEEFLRRRGNVSATAVALYVHPNTLRQRLARISEISGLDLREDDWLMVEIAVKMVRLEQAEQAFAGADVATTS
ncbi:MAG: helix-turn-helix domain-containing protein, partial [Actinomycetota bacterium]|nr:helix-turn-helix domain-containing protein [Actinomycetota bacterium]